MDTYETDVLDGLVTGFQGYLEHYRYSIAKIARYTGIVEAFILYLREKKKNTWQNYLGDDKCASDFLDEEKLRVGHRTYKQKLTALNLFQDYFCHREQRSLSARILQWWASVQKNPRIALVVKVVGVIAICATLLGGLTALQAITSQIFPSPTPTPTLVPSITPTPSPTITPTPNATQQFLTTHTVTPNAVFAPTVRTVNGTDQVWVPAGQFMMGDGYDDGMGFDDEVLHPVLTDAFWIDRYLVTNHRFSECPVSICGKPAKFDSHKRPEGYYGVGAFDDYPVIEVTWEQTNAYCTWRDGRLPTEAEWEKAAGWDPVTGKSRLYPWGDESPNPQLASYNRVDLDTSPVDSYSDGVSPVGAYDMAGNVWQFTADWYAPYIFDIGFNPTGPATGKYRVVRGGSWADKDIVLLRVSNRGYQNPANAANQTGFRCVYGE